jgi:hypothetical protein
MTHGSKTLGCQIEPTGEVRDRRGLGPTARTPEWCRLGEMQGWSVESEFVGNAPDSPDRFSRNRPFLSDHHLGVGVCQENRLQGARPACAG